MGQATGYVWLRKLFPTLAWHGQAMGPTHRSLKCPTRLKCTVVTVTSHQGTGGKVPLGLSPSAGGRRLPCCSPGSRWKPPFTSDLLTRKEELGSTGLWRSGTVATVVETRGMMIRDSRCRQLGRSGDSQKSLRTLPPVSVPHPGPGAASSKGFKWCFLFSLHKKFPYLSQVSLSFFEILKRLSWGVLLHPILCKVWTADMLKWKLQNTIWGWAQLVNSHPVSGAVLSVPWPSIISSFPLV